MTTLNLRITGMTCDHCARAVENTLNVLSGVKARVSYDEGIAHVETNDGVATEHLLKAVQHKGYGASLLEGDPKRALTGGGGEHLQVAIIGSGSGAFASAIRVAEDGATVTMIEAGTIGGTCVNVGCVPSKIMIRGAHIAHLQSDHPFDGIEQHTPAINRADLVTQQQGRVEELRYAKYEQILQTNPNVNLVRGSAHFEGKNTILVSREDGSEKRIHADRILIATGARPALPNIPGLKGTPYWTSTEALVAEELPSHLLIIGGSVVAVELAQAFRRLGSQVTILARSTLLSKEDPDLGLGLKEVFEGEGIRVLTHTVPSAVHYESNQFILQTPEGEIHGDQLLVATGRKPNTDTLQLDKAGIETGVRGAIFARRYRVLCAAGTLAASPFQVFKAGCCSARAYENVSGHGKSLPRLCMAFKWAVASSLVCPPDRNTTPATAAGTVLSRQRTVCAATSVTPALLGQSSPEITILVLRMRPSRWTRWPKSSLKSVRSVSAVTS